MTRVASRASICECAGDGAARAVDRGSPRGSSSKSESELRGGVVGSVVRDASFLEEAALLPARCAAVLVKQVELTLARLVALADQELQRLLAGGLLAAADNPAVLVLDEVLLLQTAGGLLRGAVVHLGLGTDSDGKLGHLILLTAVFFGGHRGETQGPQ